MSPSRLPPRSRLSKAQRIRLDMQTKESAAPAHRNTRSAAAAQGPSQPQVQQPDVLPTAPPQPAAGLRAPAIAPDAHAVPADIQDAMELAAQRAGLLSSAALRSHTVNSGGSPLSSAPPSSPSSVAITVMHQSQMAAEKKERQLEKSLLEQGHKDLMEEKDRVIAAQQVTVDKLMAKVEEAMKACAEYKSKANRYEGMYELQRNDHQRMFEAMLGRLNRE